jgi:hypothetical protein
VKFGATAVAGASPLGLLVTPTGIAGSVVVGVLVVGVVSDSHATAVASGSSGSPIQSA